MAKDISPAVKVVLSEEDIKYIMNWAKDNSIDCKDLFEHHPYEDIEFSLYFNKKMIGMIVRFKDNKRIDYHIKDDASHWSEYPKNIIKCNRNEEQDPIKFLSYISKLALRYLAEYQAPVKERSVTTKTQQAHETHKSSRTIYLKKVNYKYEKHINTHAAPNHAVLVRGHYSHSKYGAKYWVESYIRYKDKPILNKDMKMDFQY